MPAIAGIFDLDDTLMPERPADCAALEATAGALPGGDAATDAIITSLEELNKHLD